MKFLAYLLTCGCKALDSTLLMLLMQKQGVQNLNQATQINMMIPLLLLDSEDGKGKENSDMLMMMMMQGNSMGDMDSILPLLMLSDDSIDFQSLFLLMNMMKQGLYKRKMCSNKKYQIVH